MLSALPRLHTARDVARATGLSEERVRHLARQGVIPAVKLGRSVRFDADAVLEALRASQVPPVARLGR